MALANLSRLFPPLLAAEGGLNLCAHPSQLVGLWQRQLPAHLPPVSGLHQCQSLLFQDLGFFKSSGFVEFVIHAGLSFLDFPLPLSF
jgi:hypothetical protein